MLLALLHRIIRIFGDIFIASAVVFLVYFAINLYYILTGKADDY